jgi:hypothetical protein
LIRLNTILAVALVSALMLTVMAAPAFAFHHAFLPGGACGQSENAGGNNPTATGMLIAHNPAQGQALPLPPTGTPAAVHSERITNPPETTDCPAS